MKTRRNSSLRSMCGLCILFASLSASLSAQDAPYLGKVEIGGFAGFAGGLGRTAGGYGVSGAVAANRWLLPYGEFTYFPSVASIGVTEQANVIDPTQPAGSTTSASARFSFTDVHGGLHFRQQIAGSRVAWYPSIGIGMLRNSAYSLQFPLRNPDRLSPARDFPSETNLAVNGGAGVRWYAGESWGLRFEGKVYKPTEGRFRDPFFKAIIGFFFYAK